MARVFFFIIFLFHFKCYSQSKSIDTLNLIKTSKLIMLVDFDKEIKSSMLIDSFLSKKSSIVFLKSNGIEDIVFYYIDGIASSTYIYQVDSFNSIIYKRYFIPNMKFSPVFGYNKRTNCILRLKGFNQNDFKDLFYSIEIQNSRNGESSLSLKQLVNHQFDVDGLDLSCMYKFFKGKKSNFCSCLELAVDEEVMPIRW